MVVLAGWEGSVLRIGFAAALAFALQALSSALV
jgi:hypothetical protein